MAAARVRRSTAFGDDTCPVEKYVEHGRHIEVQVMADAHGTVLHLWERDCSTQRRHQKVLGGGARADDQRGSTPPGDRTSAVALAAQSATSTPAPSSSCSTREAPDEAYFLEMNTRLQVEHPVTELVTGLDLRATGMPAAPSSSWLSRVAAGEPLPIGQDDVTVHRSRDRGAGLRRGLVRRLPAAGRAGRPRALAARLDPVRVDHALESGQVVSTAYDPMLGKVIAHGPDRESARRSLVGALDETAILGLTTNAGFLRTLADRRGVPRRDHRHRVARPPEVAAPDPRQRGSSALDAGLAAWASRSAASEATVGPVGSDGLTGRLVDRRRSWSSSTSR